MVYEIEMSVELDGFGTVKETISSYRTFTSYHHREDTTTGSQMEKQKIKLLGTKLITFQ